MTPSSPLLLLHPLAMSASAWSDVVPLLVDHHEVFAPTALGHRGGPALIGTATIERLVDETERFLDAHSLDRVHVAGNSMGGWMAVELARRGRALSVCALSPAGFWTAGAIDQTHATTLIRRSVFLARLTRPVAPALLHLAGVRRRALADAAVHGERLSPSQALQALIDMADCAAVGDLIDTVESIDPLDPLPCPVTLAWSAKDRIFPPSINGAVALQRLPRADYVVLLGVGHVPMIDNPRSCAEAILATTGARPAP